MTTFEDVEITTESNVVLSLQSICATTNLRVSYIWTYDIYPACSENSDSSLCSTSIAQGNLCLYGNCLGSSVTFVPADIATATGTGVGGGRLEVHVSMTTAPIVSARQIGSEQTQKLDIEIEIAPSPSSASLTGRFQDEVAVLVSEVEITSINVHAGADYTFMCTPQNGAGCPSCPLTVLSDPNAVVIAEGNGEVSYVTSKSAISLQFDDSIAYSCTYGLSAAAEIRRLLGGVLEFVKTEELVVMYDSVSAPAIKWDEETRKRCTTFAQGNNLRVGLSNDFEVPYGFAVENIEWSYLSAEMQPLPLCDSAKYNCGGTGYAFVFFPAESLLPCGVYQFQVTLSMRSVVDSAKVIKSRFVVCHFNAYCLYSSYYYKILNFLSNCLPAS